MCPGEPIDKQAYGIKGSGVFLRKEEGCYFNVVDSSFKLYSILNQFGLMYSKNDDG